MSDSNGPMYGPPTPTELRIFEGMGNSRDGWRVPQWFPDGYFDARTPPDSEE